MLALMATALVGLLLYGLYHSLSVEQAQAQLEAEARDRFHAGRLRDLLRDPSTLGLVDADRRFELRQGRLQVPAWLGSRAPRTPFAATDLDLVLRDRLERMRRAWSRGCDAAVLRRDLRVLLEGQAAGPRDWLVAEFGFAALRRGMPALAEECCTRLDAEQGGAVPAAALLLHLRCRNGLPGWAERRLCGLPTQLALDLCTRVEELGTEARALRAQVARAAGLRHRLDIIAARLPRLQPGRLQVEDGELLFLHPGDPAQGFILGSGSLRSLVTQAAELPGNELPTDLAQRLVPEPRTESTEVLPGMLHLLPAQAGAPGRHTLLFGLLLLGLVLLLGSGLWILLRSNRREVELARVRQEFLTMVTHELKTPVAGIRILSEMLESGTAAAAEQQQEYYRHLGSESLRLSMLIENVLDLGRMERGERSFDQAELDLCSLTADAQARFAPIAEAEGLELQLRSELDTAPIHGDAHALLQALLNLLDNARKYAGGRVELGLVARGGDFVLSVRDFGPGIPPAEAAEVFERFRRGSAQRDGSVPGVGLGLYLARSILRHHGGELFLEDPQGPGACFCLRLPRASSQAGEPPYPLRRIGS